MVNVTISNHPVTGFTREVTVSEGVDYDFDSKYGMVMVINHKDWDITQWDKQEATVLWMDDYEAAKALLVTWPTDDDAHTTMVWQLDTANRFN